MVVVIRSKIYEHAKFDKSGFLVPWKRCETRRWKDVTFRGVINPPCMQSSNFGWAATMTVGWGDVLSAVLVGAVWGCTNPFLRKGATNDENIGGQSMDGKPTDERSSQSENQSMVQSLLRFRRVRVWLPYLLNQSGSILYYKLLATSDLSLSVPVCNALALVFSSATSFLLGERVDRPLAALFGSLLVTLGVAICMASKDDLWSAGNGGDGPSQSGDEL